LNPRPPTASDTRSAEASNIRSLPLDTVSEQGAIQGDYGSTQVGAQVREQAHGSPEQRLGAPARSQINNLPNSVMRTVVSSGSDALNLLFEVAHQQAGEEEGHTPQMAIDGTNAVVGSLYDENSTAMSSATAPSRTSRPNVLPNALSDAIHVWNACRFVKMGWLSAEEAIMFIDL
jgi:hypothetical protein